MLLSLISPAEEPLYRLDDRFTSIHEVNRNGNHLRIGEIRGGSERSERRKGTKSSPSLLWVLPIRPKIK